MLSGEVPEHGSKPHALAWVVAVSQLGSSTKRTYGGEKKILKELPCGTLPNCSAPSLEMLKARLDKALSNLI